MAEMHGDADGQPVAADDVIAEQAAELATQVSEAKAPPDRRRLARSLAKLARSGARQLRQ